MLLETAWFWEMYSTWRLCAAEWLCVLRMYGFGCIVYGFCLVPVWHWGMLCLGCVVLDAVQSLQLWCWRAVWSGDLCSWEDHV